MFRELGIRHSNDFAGEALSDRAPYCTSRVETIFASRGECRCIRRDMAGLMSF